MSARRAHRGADTEFICLKVLAQHGSGRTDLLFLTRKCISRSEKEGATQATREERATGKGAHLHQKEAQQESSLTVFAPISCISAMD